jgi:N-terminal domain of M60-like peptidases/Peptidase M60, enhancin and enhancin-like
MYSIIAIFKGLRSFKIASIFLLSLYLISCGGGGSSDTSSDAGLPVVDSGACVPQVNPATDVPVASSATDVPTISTMPEFNLDGFTQCGSEGDTLDLKKIKTHVAYGSATEKKFIYLFNQTEPVKLISETFGGDPLPSRGKTAYCKPVAKDNNDVAVFNSALTFIKAHLEGKLVLTSAQILVQNERLKQTMYAVTESKEALLQAFSIIRAYEKMRGGAFFANAKTKNGFPNENYGDTERDIDRAVLTIQQGIHDTAFTSDKLAKYKDVLAGKKFNSADWFPGIVKAKADSCQTYSVRINATMAKDVDIQTASSQGFARRPTGYYLAAGDVAKLTVPASMVNKGFVVQVGANVHDKTIKSTIERPFRVTSKYPIVSEVTEIANPNGGGIYIDVPYLANAGADVTIKILNAVPAPFFSATAINKTTLAQWKAVQSKNPAPWADFMSDKFMMTLPTSWIYNYADPVALMTDWDNRMDVVSDFVGRSRVRNNQILYLIVDTALYGDAFGIGYPTGNNGYNPGDATDGNNKSWFLTPGKDFFEIEFHELGHAQLFGNFPGEGEAAVNMLTVALSNKLYNVDIDFGLGKSMNNTTYLGRELAAVNWMVTPNFKAGKAMDISHTTKDEVQYQQRGYAKYVEIAALFGWTALESFYKEENRVAGLIPQPASDGLSNVDSRIFRMSKAAGVDLTPLIHFWGVQPADYVKLKTAIAGAGLKPSALIYDRLLKYQAIIPMDNATFKVHAAAFWNKPVNKITAGFSPDYGEGWYYVWLPKYGPADGQAAKAALTDILTKYFPAGRP